MITSSPSARAGPRCRGGTCTSWVSDPAIGCRRCSREVVTVDILPLSRWRPTASNPMAEGSMCHPAGAWADCPTTPMRTRQRPTWPRQVTPGLRREPPASSSLLAPSVAVLLVALTALGYLAHRVRDANFANEGGEEHANHARPQDVALVASVGPEHPDDAMGCPKDDLVERLVGERSR